MTQLEEFKSWAKNYTDLEMFAPALRVEQQTIALFHMREIVAAAQNRPPQGRSDGSFSQTTWIQARDLVAAMTSLLNTEAKIHSALDLVRGW